MFTKIVTLQDLKNFLNTVPDNNPELQKAVRVFNAMEESPYEIMYAAEVIDEDMVNMSGEGWEPISVYREDPDYTEEELQSEVVMPGGSIFFYVDQREGVIMPIAFYTEKFTDEQKDLLIATMEEFKNPDVKVETTEEEFDSFPFFLQGYIYQMEVALYSGTEFEVKPARDVEHILLSEVFSAGMAYANQDIAQNYLSKDDLKPKQ